MKNKQAELIKQLTDRQLSQQLILTQLLLLFVALLLGFIFFTHWSEFTSLIDFTDKSIWTLGVPAGILVVVIDLLFMRWLPEKYFDDGGINERIFGALSISAIFGLTALVAISEEILFRGVIQAEFGIWIASLVFAFIHVRYLYNWFLFSNILLLSFFIGIIFEITGNLVVTITMHFVIDLCLGIMLNRKAAEQKKEGEGDQDEEQNGGTI